MKLKRTSFDSYVLVRKVTDNSVNESNNQGYYYFMPLHTSSKLYYCENTELQITYEVINIVEVTAEKQSAEIITNAYQIFEWVLGALVIDANGINKKQVNHDQDKDGIILNDVAQLI